MAIITDSKAPPCDHEWGEPHILGFDCGPLDGDWTRENCTRCEAVQYLPVGSDDDRAFAAWAIANLPVIEDGRPGS